MNVYLSRMHVDDQLRKAVSDVLDSGRYINGPNLQSFEEEFASLCGTGYAVGVSSGTSAVLLSLMALGIAKGDEVIVPSLTFIATATPALFLGATPVYADIDPVTCTIDPSDVQKRITPKTRAIVPVHLYGHTCDMDPVNELARKHGLHVIEDACQSHGATYRDRKTGSLADIGCFSFFPSKNMTVLGDGGMITTDDEKIAQKLRMLRNHGRTEKYSHEILGLNCRLSELHAAIGREQLRHLAEWNERRRAVAERYNELLAGTDAVLPVEREWARHVYYMYVIRVRERDRLASHLKQKGIETGIHYPVPLHRQPLTKTPARLPITEQCVDEILSLPMHPLLRDEEVEYVASETRSFLEENRWQG